VTIERFGPASGLVVADLPDPEVLPGTMLIGVEAIGVGGVDAVIRRGTLGSGFPVGMIPGSEVAGTVVRLGAGVDEAWLGKRVWAFTGTQGAYAESAVAAEPDVTELPDGLTAAEAVTLGSAGPVSHFALRHGRFAAGESVLVRGAAGSLGIMAVQLAARGGASRVAVTTSSRDRGERLVALGATEVLDRDGNGADGNGADGPGDDAAFDVVLDIVGGDGLPSFFDRLAPNGRVVSVGVVGGYPPPEFGMQLMRLFQKSLSFATFSLATVPVPERNRERARLFDSAARGEVVPVIDSVLPLAEAAEAHRRMDEGAVFGRTVLVP
jgi:NADPH2:quinone reductase